MKKRILSLIMAVIMILGVFPVSAFAEEAQECNHNYVNGKCEICDELDPEAPKSRFTVSASTETVNKGETFTVTVSLDETISKSEDITNVQGELYYDSSVLTYVSHELGEDYYDDYVEGHNAANERVQFSRTSMTAKPFEVPAGVVLTVTFKAAEEMSESHIKSALRFRSKLVTSTTVTTIANAYDFVLVVNEHVWEDGKCTECGAECAHAEYEDGKCKVCGKAEPVVDVDIEVTADTWKPYVTGVNVDGVEIVSGTWKQGGAQNEQFVDIYVADKDHNGTATVSFVIPEGATFGSGADMTKSYEVKLTNGSGELSLSPKLDANTLSGFYGTLKISFYPVVSMSSAEAVVDIGGKVTLTATGASVVFPEAPEFTWVSSDESIATVDANGAVTGVAYGEATITATAGEYSASCKVTVAPIVYSGTGVPHKSAYVSNMVLSSSENLVRVDATDPMNPVVYLKNAITSESDVPEIIVNTVTSGSYTANITKGDIIIVDGEAAQSITVEAYQRKVRGTATWTVTFIHEHDWKDATCTEPKTCSKCGETEGEALGHKMEKSAEKVEPTCETEGKEAVYTCANGCGKTEGGEKIEALGHKMEKSAEKVEPTCETEGKEAVYTCANGCGKTEGGEKIEALGHKMEKSAEKVEPTCETEGKEAVYTCANGCGKTEGGEKIEALGHKMEKSAEKVEPTCETEGKEAVYTCANGCGKTEGGEKIEALGHKMEKSAEKVEPTCETEGKEAVYTCANGCGKTEGGEEVPALGHDWADATYDWAENGTNCTASRVCKNNETHVEYAPATVTSVVAKEANCSVMGDTQYTATFAADWAETQVTVRTDIAIDEDAHEWGEWEVVKEASYTEEGSKKRVCENDESHVETETIAKLVPTATEKTEGPDDTKEYVVAYQEGVVMVPAGLENEYPNQQAVKDALKAKVENGDLDGEVNLVFREVTVGYYENGAFVPVSNGEFFENGKTIEILLKYPEGADKNDKFEVYHLRDDGVIEKCVIKDKTDKGLVIEVNSLSPFAIAYESVNNTPSWPSNPGKPSKPSNKPNPGITIITPEDEKEEANPNTGAPVVCSFDLTAAGAVVLAATAAVLEIKRRK